MREFIDRLERAGMLKIELSVDPKLQLTEKLKNSYQSYLFKSARGYKNFRIAANLITDRKHLAIGLGCKESELINKINSAIEKPRKCKIVDKAAFMQSSCSLDEIPIPTYFKTDAGPYLTSAIVIAKDPEHGQNVSFHRMMKRKDHLVIRLLPRHTWEFYQRAKRNLDIVICIGCQPEVLVAAAINTKLGQDELEIASALGDKSLEVFDLNGIKVPAECEIAIEATITDDFEDEGPFVDITRTFDYARKQPVVRIKKIHCRREPVFHALLPGGYEHGAVWKISTEAAIYNGVSKVCDCKDAFLSFGGCSRLHGIVQIRKRGKDDGKKAIEAAFEAHKSMKHVFIVDEDIDITNPGEVEWALATRFQAKNDLIVKYDVIGSSLDPSSDDGKTSKLGFDCTIKGKKEYFEKLF